MSRTLDTIDEAVGMIFDDFNKNKNENVELKDGSSLAGVFNDGIIFINYDSGEFKINVIAGEPSYYNFDLNLLEENKSNDG